MTLIVDVNTVSGTAIGEEEEEEEGDARKRISRNQKTNRLSSKPKVTADKDKVEGEGEGERRKFLTTGKQWKKKRQFQVQRRSSAVAKSLHKKQQ
jgi:hypothetical protein